MSKIEELIIKIENENGELNASKKTTAYRCALLGIPDNLIEILLKSNYSLIKEEAIISCFLDNLDIDFIINNIIQIEDAEEIIKQKADYILSNFKHNDKEYNQLQNQLQEVIAKGEDLNRQLQQVEEYADSLKATIIEREKKISELDLELQKSFNNYKSLARDNKEKVITYKKPCTMKEKIAFLRTGELEKIEQKQEANTLTIFDILCDPTFTIGQLKEIEQAYSDGLSYEQIYKIANNNFTEEKMYELRRFICELYGLKCTPVNTISVSDTTNKEQQKYNEDISEDCSDEDVNEKNIFIPENESFSINSQM